ncbi:MAG: hypothetical protein E6K13_03310 [Methanobacteriota archaeon]|nr:MAG: hypothetical protein E6K13_03310 [Euryarchaeota archaeon]
MWTDMSEIVRPTRDGIHGREYISTTVDIGARPTYLDFRQGGPWSPPREIPIPMILDAANAGTPPAGILAAFVGAAKALETYAVVPAKSWAAVGVEPADRVIVRLTDGEVTGFERAAGVEATYHTWDGADLGTLRKTLPHGILSLRVPLSTYEREAADVALDAGADLIHFTCDWKDVDTISGINQYIRSLRDLHARLLEVSRRDAISVLASGPIAAAEHVPKTIILGADAVGVDLALYAVMECVPPNHALHLGRFPEEFPLSDVPWGTQRIVNLMNAWRDQLLEIMGAMGMREVRRLRGETGRAIFQDEAEREAFGDIKVRQPAKEVVAR